MWKCRPGKWLLWAPLAVIPAFLAWKVNGVSIQNSTLEAAKAELAKGGADWEKVALAADGRDLTVNGSAGTQELVDKAVAAVAGTYGVRRVNSADIKVVEVPKMQAPTVSGAITNNTQPEIKGTWSEGIAKSLIVKLAEKAFTFGTDKELTSDGAGNWLLKVPAALADGSYDVTVETGDGKSTLAAETPAKIVVDTVAPPTASFLPIALNAIPAAISGLWPEGEATGLKVAVGPDTYELGKDEALKSEAGKWVLMFPKALVEGIYDVAVEVADAAGNVTNFKSPGAIVVDMTPPKAPEALAIASQSAVSEIGGAWDEAGDHQLAVTVGPSTYNYRSYMGLTSNRGNWRLKLPEPLPDGVTPVKVVVTDKAGNVSESVGTVSVDATSPAAPTVDSVVSNTSLSAVSGSWDENGDHSLAVTVDGSTYNYRSFMGLTTDTKGKWTLALPQALGEGAHAISVVTADKAGNSSSGTGQVTIDTLAPAAPAIDSVVSKAPVGEVSGSWDENGDHSLAVTVDGSTYNYRSFMGLTTDTKGHWRLALPSALSEGAHVVSASTTDKAGNSTSGSGTIVVDSTAPKAPTVDAVTATVPQQKVSGTWDENGDHSLAVTVDGSTYNYRSFMGLTTDTKGKWLLALPQMLGIGSHDVTVVTADKAGNESSVTAPGAIQVVDMPKVPTVNAYAGNDTTPVITGLWEEKAGSSLAVAVGGKSYALGSGLSSDGNGNWSLTPEPLKDGIYDVVATVTSAAGEAVKDETVAEVEIDTAGPSAPTVSTLAAAVASPAIIGTWPKGEAASLAVSLNGETYTLGSSPELTSDDAGTWTLVPKPLPDGIHDVEVTAADRFGNPTSDATLAEIEIDTTGPAAPTVNEGTTLPVTGGFDPRDTRSLKVSFNGKTFVLGTDAALTADGAAWSLAAEAGPGTYDVVAEAADALGNITKDATADEIKIAEPPPPPPPPPEMIAPTVNAAMETVARPKVTGSFDNASAVALKVSLNGADYELGAADSPLTATGGVWTLAVPRALKDGTYDVAVTSTDAAGKTASDSSKDELTVDAAGPATPTVNLYSSEKSPEAIGGTWAEGDAVTLYVTFLGETVKLGDPRLVSTNGAWTLRLKDQLKPGSYDAGVVTADKLGRIASDQTKFEIRVKDAPVVEPPPPPPPPPPVDCGGELARLLILKPITFETDKWALRAADADTIATAAALIGQCPDKRFEVGGHTDSMATKVYNQALSERRARSVMKGLIAAGVAESSISAKGYGEDAPLATNETPEGRSVNRRIEIKIVE